MARSGMSNRVAQIYIQATAKHRYSIYPDPETSEVSEEADSVQKILKYRATPKAEIICNGDTIALEKGRRWELTPLGKRRLEEEKSGK